MGKYALFEERSDPDTGCEIWFYTNERCERDCVVAVVNKVDKHYGDPPEGFHVAHMCRPHGEWVVEDLNSRFENLSDEDKRFAADGHLNFPDM